MKSDSQSYWNAEMHWSHGLDSDNIEKNFSSDTLMERLNNFIDLTIPIQVNKIFQSFHECVWWKILC